jgi:hypothetical protein
LAWAVVGWCINTNRVYGTLHKISLKLSEKLNSESCFCPRLIITVQQGKSKKKECLSCRT